VRDVAISACLLGRSCRYDASDNLNDKLLSGLKLMNLIPFCPEDYAFGTPRPTMDLIQYPNKIRAISNQTQEDLSDAIFDYAKDFFRDYPSIDIFIGKDRSPSCAVCSGKVYNKKKEILHTNGTGLMAQVALDLGIEAWDAEEYLAILPKNSKD